MYYFKTYFWNIWKIWRLIENPLSESFNSQSKYFNFWARRNVNWKYWFGFYHHQTSLHHLKSNFYFRNSHWCDHMKGSVRRQVFDHYRPVFYICDGQQDWIHAKLTYYISVSLCTDQLKDQPRVSPFSVLWRMSQFFTFIVTNLIAQKIENGDDSVRIETVGVWWILSWSLTSFIKSCFTIDFFHWRSFQDIWLNWVKKFCQNFWN